MGNSAVSAAHMTGAGDAGRRWRVISGAGATTVAGAALAIRQARRARRVTAYVVSGRIGAPGLVTPVRTASNTAGPPITVGPGPFDIAITPNGKTAYVLNFNGDTVTPIRTATNTAGPPITVGNEPFGIAITPNGKTAYVTGGTDSVTPTRTATNTAGPPITVGIAPNAIAIT